MPLDFIGAGSPCAVGEPRSKRVSTSMVHFVMLKSLRIFAAARGNCRVSGAPGAMAGELAPLKLEKAKFRVVVEPLAEDRAGPSGLDRVAFEIATTLSAFSAAHTWSTSGLAEEPTGIPAFRSIAADSPASAWSYPETCSPSALA